MKCLACEHHVTTCKCPGEPTAVVPQWEYLEALLHEVESAIETLDNLGRDGWELVSVVEHKDTLLYTFKRRSP